LKSGHLITLKKAITTVFPHIV
jgi:hypothetical protein